MGCVMHPDDGRLIARLQKLTTELLADKRLGRWRAETVNDLPTQRRTSRILNLESVRRAPRTIGRIPPL